MDTKYEEGIRCLKKCWKEHGHILTEDEKAAMKAFRGVFISGKSEPYSHELALKWLSDNQLAWGDEKYQRHRKIIYELNDAVTNGTIREDYSYLDPLSGRVVFTVAIPFFKRPADPLCQLRSFSQGQWDPPCAGHLNRIDRRIPCLRRHYRRYLYLPVFGSVLFAVPC